MNRRAGKALVEGEIAGHAVAGDATSAKRSVQGGAIVPGGSRPHSNKQRVCGRSSASWPARIPSSAAARMSRLSDLTAFGNWRSAKVQTRCGMGPCQGRACGPALEALFGWRHESIRPPCLPVKVRTLAAGG